MTKHRFPATLTVLAAALLAGCGGGSSSDPVDPGASDDARITAATATANNNEKCSNATIGPFYWEIGDQSGAKASGSVGSGAPTASTVMSIASASKWVYSTYVVQRVGGVRASDVPYLNFTSGYSRFGLPLCKTDDTVGSCLDGNDDINPATVGKFYYDSGHMQQHAAVNMGLAPMDSTALTTEVKAEVGSLDFVYTQPQLAGGIATNAADYARFLRNILSGNLDMKGALGSNKVCTNSATCNDAVASPIPDTESWNYSLGHWVEDDPKLGDHAFSSAGALGFYPWIDQTKTIYGVLARRVEEANAGYHSAECGRLIRQAWVTGTEVKATSPTP